LSIFEGDLAIDSAESVAYISDKVDKIYYVELLNPLRNLVELFKDAHFNTFRFINDDFMLVGAPQGNPEFKSKEKYSLYNLSKKQFEAGEFYAQKNWFYILNDGSFVVLEAKKDSWIIRKISPLGLREEFSYEYLSNKTPEKILFDQNSQTLFVTIDNNFYALKILL